MNKYIIASIVALIAASVMIGLGGFLIKGYGDAKFAAGEALKEKECIAAFVDSYNKNLTNRATRDKKNNSLSDDDLHKRWLIWVRD